MAGYQHTMNDLAPRGSLEVWQSASRADDLVFAGIEIDARSQAVVTKAVEKARRKNNQSLLARVGERRTDGGWRFREDAPILVRVDDATREAVTSGLERYAETLPRERRFFFYIYKVFYVFYSFVLVGSVGT
ncbi:DUF2252 family protein, partial [Methylobacterium sp. WL93]|uniref:DUF2252 family protein n=1 Tax=Methylobacterium sp. WL93 TaxID=2603892 RepID=UPI002484C9F0